MTISFHCYLTNFPLALPKKSAKSTWWSFNPKLNGFVGGKYTVKQSTFEGNWIYTFDQVYPFIFKPHAEQTYFKKSAVISGNYAMTIEIFF